MEFISKDDECLYWKERSDSFQEELLMVQEDFHNYQISSKELEEELELQLDDFEAKNKNLIIMNEKINFGFETLQCRLSETSKTFNIQINELQDELTRVKIDKFTLQKYIRELEQTNDDLERSLRATVTSLQDFEQKLNIALEKNAILENELDEREVLVERVQRLKDETRELRQDLQVKDLHMNQIQDYMSQLDKDALAISLIEERTDPPTYHCSVAIQTDIHMQSSENFPNNYSEFDYPYFYHWSSNGQFYLTRNKNIPNTSIQTPLTPAARVSALNLVSDMLKKIGAIEHKLSSAAQRGLLGNEIIFTPCGSRTSLRQ